MKQEHLHQTERSDDSTVVRAKTESEQPRENPATKAREEPRRGGPSQAVLTLVCETCGKDYFFEDETPPGDMQCDKCGSNVFRSFYSTVGDEAADDFRDSTERDLDPDDAEGDTLPGDVMDLNHL